MSFLYAVFTQNLSKNLISIVGMMLNEDEIDDWPLFYE